MTSNASEPLQHETSVRMVDEVLSDPQVVQVTLESGLGHQTVPLLLTESSFNGSAKNWSSLLQLKANMTLEVRTAASPWNLNQQKQTFND